MRPNNESVKTKNFKEILLATETNELLKPKILEKINSLLKENQKLEDALLTWLQLEVCCREDINHSDLFYNPVYFESLINSRQFSPEFKDHTYFRKPSVFHMVEWIDEVWLKSERIDIFVYFSKNLQKAFSPDFDFKKNFEEVFLSTPSTITICLFVGLILTALLIHEIMDGEYDFSITKISENMDKDTQITLSEAFKTIIEIYDLLVQEDDMVSEMSQRSPVISLTKASRDEINLFRKIEELKVENDKLSSTKNALSTENEKLKQTLEKQEHEILELQNDLRHMTNAHEDLKTKLIQGRLDLVNDEIKDQAEKIATLVSQIKFKDDRIQTLIIDVESYKDALFKKENELKITTLALQNGRSDSDSEVAYREKYAELKEKYDQIMEEKNQMEHEMLEQKEKAMRHTLTVNRLEQDLEKLAQEKIKIEGHLHAINQSENVLSSMLYIQDFDDLLKQMASPELIKRIKACFHKRGSPRADKDFDLLSIDEPVKKFDYNCEMNRLISSISETTRDEVVTICRDYQIEVVVKFKTILVELNDKRENLKRILEDVEKMKDEIEDLNFRADENDNKILVELLMRSDEIKSVFDRVEQSLHTETSILHDLLKKITKKEAEIIRLTQNRKRTQNELVTQEAINKGHLELVYITTVQHLINSIS